MKWAQIARNYINQKVYTAPISPTVLSCKSLNTGTNRMGAEGNCSLTFW
jgi:hypothetical protein